MWRRLKAPGAGPDGACIRRHINEVAAARAHLLTAGRTGCQIERDAGACKASGAVVIRKHPSACETRRPVINESAPAINGPATVCLITASARRGESDGA